MADNSVDSVVTDPPYGLSFMGKKWDYDVPGEEVWKECLRVLKPGGHLLAFAGTRTQHRMAVRIEDAGFEIRDMIAWVYGSGFPKSHDVSKAIDKTLGVERERNVVPEKRSTLHGDRPWMNDPNHRFESKEPVSKEAKQWEGWGTALKPALEPITVARKPLGEKTVAQNVLTHGTGGLNIDGCRVEFNNEPDSRVGVNDKQTGAMGKGAFGVKTGADVTISTYKEGGRFPANLIHDGSEEVVGLFPQTKSGGGNKGNVKDGTGMFGNGKAFETPTVEPDSGSAARFFYCAKASKKDRDEGLEGFEAKQFNYQVKNSEWNIDPRHPDGGYAVKPTAPMKNHHPTVKPTDLMRYLCRLVTPKGGTVLDPFMGSGSTGKAARLEGFDFIGIEREEEYIEIARARICLK